MDQNFHDFVQQLPKVELHAHLNGCIRQETLFALAAERRVTLPEYLFATPAAADTTTESASSSSPQQPYLHHHQMYNALPRSLQDCFDMFAELPKCVNDKASLQRITREALQDFASQHVAYLELRSTPKRLLQHYADPNSVMTKRDYIETVLDVMHEFETQEMMRYQQEIATKEAAALLQEKKYDDADKNNDDDTINHAAMVIPKQRSIYSTKRRLPMVCRFIAAIDRSESVQAAQETIDLVIEMINSHESRTNKSSNNNHANMIVGFDLGGNPLKGNFEDFLPLFQRVRATATPNNRPLKITIHCGEVPCDPRDNAKAFAEAAAILQFGPDRVGHALLLPECLQEELYKKNIPVETCPTSNVMTLELAGQCQGNLIQALKQHHVPLRKWLGYAAEQNYSYHQNHPVAICTDDPGVFDTTLTKELILVSLAFHHDTDGDEKCATNKKRELADLAVAGIEYAFCDETTRQATKERLQEYNGGDHK